MPRITNTLLKTALENNDPFVYAHLIKFERPRVIPITNGQLKIDTDASKYAYITDGAYNISFDDGTTDLEGNANGSQVYVANKVTSIGNITESAELKISSMSLGLDATTAKISIAATWTISGTTITLSNPASGQNFLDAGFQEDDTITFSAGSNTTNNYRILKIQNNGNSATLAIGEKTSSIVTESSISGNILLDSSELNTVLSETQSTNFVNRKVTIYKVFLGADDPSTFIGTPLCIFAGIITSATYTNDPSQSTKLNWGMKSNWGDFKQVRGRLSSKEFHQALDEYNTPNEDATLRKEYAKDKGFEHADRAIDITAVYQTMETRMRTWYKKKWFKKKFHMEEYEVEVDREADLNLNLQSKYIPLIYGVRRTGGNPIFADTAKDDAADVFIGEVICEGPIHGILNIGLDEKSTICLDAIDETARATANADENTDLVCYGRADAGAVIGGTNNATSAIVDYNSNNTSFNNTAGITSIGGLVAGQIEFTTEEHRHAIEAAGLAGSDLIRNNAGNPTTNAAGIVHEQHFAYNSPQEIRGEFHAGKADQATSKMFFEQANNTSKGFKLQHSTYGDNLGGDYWGASHRLLDTAWVATRQTVSADETDIIPLDFTVKGKLVECKNYDASYEHDPNSAYTSESIANFNLGDTVTLKTAVAFSYSGTNYAVNDALASNVTIKDLFFLYAGSTTKDWRLRWDLTAAQSTLLKQAKSFYMQKGSDDWHMVTYDFTQSCAVGVTLIGDITAQGQGGPNELVNIEAGDWPADLIQEVSDLGPRGTIIQKSLLRNLGSDYDLTITHTGSIYKVQLPSYVTNNSGTSDTAIALTNIVKLDSSNSFSNADTTIYDGKKLTITKTKSSGDKVIIEKFIKKYVYNGGNKYFVVTTPFAIKDIPELNDAISVDLGSKDIRTTTNPAMQLLDYMSSKRYGAAIEEEDIDLNSFLLAAQVCDTQSDITVGMAGSLTALAVGDIYKWEGGGLSNAGAYWRGTVKAFTAASGGNPATIVFTDCIGKLTHKYNDWATRSIGEVVWDRSGAPRRITANGVQTAFTSNSAALSTIGMTKISGSGPATINADSSAGNPLEYSLYDCDDVKYWKYLGWESQDQRWVTRHQCNIEIDTSGPVFNTAQAIIDHFNGIITFSEGKYKLGVKTKRDTAINISADRPSHYIQQEDIIGKISIKDPGLSKSYNSLSANIKDPQNNFGQRQINFFDSNYLKQDRGIVRSTNFGVDGITNYFNARMMVKQILDSSRFNRSITFKMRPTGLNLLPGEIIEVVDDDLGWSGKYFRVETLSVSKDCLVSVTAKEHNDSIYTIGALRNSAFFIDSSSERTAKIPSAPTGVAVATANTSSPNIVSWNPSVGISTTSGHYEIWKKNSLSGNPSTPVTTHAELVATIPAEVSHTNTDKPSFADIGFTNTSVQTFHYWVRAYNTLNLQTTLGSRAPKNYYSPFNANSNYGGETIASASSQAISSTISVNVKTSATLAECDSSGSIVLTGGVIPNSGNEFHVFEGLTELQFDGVGTNNGSWKVVLNASNVTPGSVVDSGTYATVNAATAMSANSGEIVFNFSGKTSGGDSFTFTRTQQFAKNIPGETGTAVELVPNKYVVNYTKAGSESDTISFTATPRNMSSFTPHYQFSVGASIKQAYGATATFTLADSDEPTTGNSTLVTVDVKHNGSGDVLAGDSVSIYGVQDGKDAVTGFLTNPSQTIPAENDGTLASGALSGVGGTFKVFIGGTERTTHSAVTFAASGASGMSAAINSSTGVYTVSALTADAANVNFTATIAANESLGIESQTVVGPIPFTMAKSKKGAQGNSITGATGPRTATGRLYFNASSASAPASPTISGFVYSAATFSTKPSNWVYAPPTYASGNTNKYWYISYTVTEASFGGTQTINKGAVTQAIGFSGLVTFTSANVLSDGTNTKTPIEAGQVNANVTSIDGGIIDTGVINLGTANGMAIRQNKTGYTSTAGGFWLGNDGGTAKFNLGEANKYLKWDGSTLNIKGGIQGDLAGGLTVGTSGFVAGGQTQYNNGTGFFLGYQSGYKFSIGNPSGQRITWDGSSLTINGAVTFSNSPNISSFNNDSGFTNDDTANAANTAAGSAQGTASAAATAASNAATAAGNASTLAASKVRVFRQTSTPTALAIGDLWYDTDDNNKLYIATATGTGSWSASDLTSINGGVIATGTLAAASIVGDSITANQMAANSIDASELKISSTSSSASSMFFDGTNTRIDIKDASGVLRVRIGNL